MDRRGPLSSPVPSEIPLPNTPLVRVIAQVRFPTIVSIEKSDFIAPIQEELRPSYPILRPEKTSTVMLGPSVVPVAESPSMIWRFFSPDSAWRISVASGFAAIETTQYQGRTDFMNRWSSLLGGLEKFVHPQYVDRLGLRYIDRLGETHINRLETLLRPEIRGITGMGELVGDAQHVLTEALFSVQDSGYGLLARWGMLPPNATVDPTAIDPIPERCWLLDIDSFIEQQGDFGASGVLERSQFLSERAYTFFRWAVTDEFLRTFGGVL